MLIASDGSDRRPDFATIGVRGPCLRAQVERWLCWVIVATPSGPACQAPPHAAASVRARSTRRAAFPASTPAPGGWPRSRASARPREDGLGRILPVDGKAQPPQTDQRERGDALRILDGRAGEVVVVRLLFAVLRKRNAAVTDCGRRNDSFEKRRRTQLEERRRVGRADRVERFPARGPAEGNGRAVFLHLAVAQESRPPADAALAGWSLCRRHPGDGRPPCPFPGRRSVHERSTTAS